MDPRMQRLPTELVQDIIDYRLVGCANELANLCLVSSAVRPRVEPVLYRTVFLTTRRQFSSFLRSCAITSNRLHTRSLSVALYAHEALPPGELDALLRRLPKLETLRVSTPNVPHMTQTYNISRLRISNAILPDPWARGPVAPRITHLFLEDPHCIGTAAQVRALFPALTHAAFVANSLIGPLLSALMRGCLAIRTLQRLTVIYILDGSMQGQSLFAQFLPALRSVEDERVYAYEFNVLSISSLLLRAKRRRRLQVGASALGVDTLRGIRDVWDTGTCVCPGYRIS